MYFQDLSSCLLCAGDVHEEQEITTDIGDRNIREVIVINDEKKILCENSEGAQRRRKLVGLPSYFPQQFYCICISDSDWARGNLNEESFEDDAIEKETHITDVNTSISN